MFYELFLRAVECQALCQGAIVQAARQYDQTCTSRVSVRKSREAGEPREVVRHWLRSTGSRTSLRDFSADGQHVSVHGAPAWGDSLTADLALVIVSDFGHSEPMANAFVLHTMINPHVLSNMPFVCWGA